MCKPELLRNVGKMQVGNPELVQRIAYLKPGPKRDGNYPPDCNHGCGANGDGPKLRTRRPPVQRKRFEPAQGHRTDKIRMGNDSTRARADCQARGQTGANRCRPCWHHPPSHKNDGECRQTHRGEKRNINWAKKQPAIQVTGDQAEYQRGWSGPTPD